MKDTNTKKSLIIFALIILVTFYLLPLLFKGSIGLLFIINPLVTLISSIILSKKHGFNILTIVIVAALFSPTIYIFYNDSAWIYIVFYVIISIIGNIIGYKIN